MAELRVARSELVLGSGAGGRSARAEALARAWTSSGAGRQAVCIETTQSWDEELRGLVDRCRRQPPGGTAQLPRVEEATELAHALGAHSRPDTLIVVDCLSFWLTASLMQAMGPEEAATPGTAARGRPLRMIDAVNACAGPLVLVSSRIESPRTVSPPDMARMVATLDTLEQQAALACERVTLMSGGLPLTLKDRS